MKEDFSIVLELTQPSSHDGELIVLQNHLVLDIESWDGKLPFNSEYFLSGSNLKISIYKNPTDYIPYRKYFKTHPFVEYYLLVFKVVGECNWEKIDSILKDKKDCMYSDDLIAEYKNTELIEAVTRQIYNFFLVANIAFPGALNTYGGISLISNHKFGGIDSFSAESISNALLEVEKLGWPKLQKISILEAWDWLNKSNCLIDGLGKNSLGRALAAFSQIIKISHNGDSTLDIVWALLGLEALYTKGNTGLKEQLVSKTEALLGKKEENKKAFGNMYDFRSRLIHGDIDIPLNDPNCWHENFMESLHQSESIAIITLIATFQKMIQNNWKELEFNYTVSGK